LLCIYKVGVTNFIIFNLKQFKTLKSVTPCDNSKVIAFLHAQTFTFNVVSKSKNMEIKPGIGFDNIKFGMSRDEILKILGEPNRVVTGENDEFEQRLEWYDKKIRLTFQLDENDRFTYLTSKNDKTEYNGQKIIGLNIDFVKNKLFRDLVTDWVVEDYQFFETHFNENLWLNIRSEFEKVIEFEMGVPFKSDNIHRWPE